MDFDAITIDTSIFEAYGAELENGILNSIKTFTKNKIEIVIPDIIEKEILAHLIKKTQESRNSAYGKLRELKKYNLLSETEVNNLIHLLEQNNVFDIVNCRWNVYKKLNKIHILSSNNVLLNEVIQDYFDEKPPFSEKKKCEFPDAIALKTLKSWAETNNKKTLCISTDGDWENYINGVENLRYSKDISGILGELNKDIQLSDIVKLKISSVLIAIECSDIGLEADKESHLWEPFFDKIEQIVERKSVTFGGNINFYGSISDYSVGLSSFTFPNHSYEILSYDNKEEVIDILIPITLEYFIKIEAQSAENNTKTVCFSDIECSFDTKAIIQMDFKTKEIIQNVEITSSVLPVNLDLIKNSW